MIEILRPWRRYKPGDRIDLGRPVNRVLVRRGIAAEVVPDSPRKPRRGKRIVNAPENAAQFVG